MKTDISPIQAREYSNPEAEAALESGCNSIHEFSHQHGRALTLNTPSLPRSKGDDFLYYLDLIIQRYLHLKSEVLHIARNMEFHYLTAIQETKQLRDELKTVQESIDEFDNHQLSKAAVTPTELKTNILLLTGASLLGLFLLFSDFFGTASSLQIFKLSRLMASILAAAFTAALVVMSHYVIKVIIPKYVKNPIAQKIVAGGGIAALFGVYYWLGSQRNAFQVEMSGTSLSAFAFAIFSIVVFLAVYALYDQFIQPRIRAIRNDLKIKTHNKEILEHIQKGEELHIKKEQLENSIVEVANSRKDKMLYSQGIVLRIEKSFQLSASYFRQSNLSSRKDGGSDCFRQTVPPLDTQHDGLLDLQQLHNQVNIQNNETV